MNTTCIIPRSTIEKRYDKAREDFNDQYDNSPYKLKCKEFYIGGGVENYEVASQILSMNRTEEQIEQLQREGEQVQHEGDEQHGHRQPLAGVSTHKIAYKIHGKPPE